MGLSYLGQAFVLGLSAALLPGALQAFFLAQTLRLGWFRALPLALTPLLSDGPLVVVTLWLLDRLPPTWVHFLELGGGVYLLYLAWGLARQPVSEGSALDAGAGQVRTLFQAVTINWLNPNPYIFWATVLGPLVLEGWRAQPAWGLGFIAVFYATMLGGNAVLIWVFGRLGRLPLQWRRVTIRGAAFILALFGLRFLARGLGSVLGMLLPGAVLSALSTGPMGIAAVLGGIKRYRAMMP